MIFWRRKLFIIEINCIIVVSGFEVEVVGFEVVIFEYRGVGRFRII